MNTVPHLRGLLTRLRAASHHGRRKRGAGREVRNPHPIFPFLQKHGGVETEEMFRVFNMGIGYTIIVRREGASAVMKALRKLGEEPLVIGVVEKGKGDCRVV